MKFDEPSLTHSVRRRRRSAALAARPLGRRLVPRASPTRATATARRAPPSSRSTRCSSGRWARSAEAPAGRAARRRLRRLARGVRSARSGLLHRLVALELGRAPRAADAAAAGALPRRRSSSARPTRRACSCSRRWAPSTPRAPGAGPGPAPRAAAASATRSAGIVLLLPLVLSLVAVAAARACARAPGWLLAPLGLAAYAAYLGLVGGRRACASSTSRTPGRASSPGRSWAPGTGSWRPWTACASSLSGSRTPVYFEQAGGDPFGGGGASTSCCSASSCSRRGRHGRRLAAPAARLRASTLVAALALPLSFPVGPAAADVAAALPRRAVPDLHVARGVVRGAPQHASTWLALSAIGLGLFTAQFAAWHLIA